MKIRNLKEFPGEFDICVVCKRVNKGRPCWGRFYFSDSQCYTELGAKEFPDFSDEL